ncbi:MAG: glycosyltransferase [Paludibacteraceae bacterium]|nr:glycosyltransferase [Paludibacteraceae bacterium]
MQAIHGDPLMRVSSDMPDDVLVLHDALEQLREHKTGEPLTLYLKNCGTALRFLQVHLEYCYKGEPIVLDGDPRLMERDGAPTTQTTSALILHGEPIPVSENESPYITMSRRVAERYPNVSLETDWSAAAFWYEYVAIHGGELLLEGLQPDSLQGDRIVADLYAKYFGVETEFIEDGALIRSVSPKDRLSTFDFEQRGLSTLSNAVSIDFTNCPDLYPVIALTCERLGITLQATGTDRLRHKESDRIEAVRLHEVRNDHRMAMALLAADFITLDSPSDSNSQAKNDLQTCIAKSYPQFIEIFSRITTVERRSTDGQPTVKANVSTLSVTHITPIRGVNDDNLGKKHALSKLIHAATTEYVWLHDDDVILPPVCQPEGRSVFCQPKAVCQHSGLVILPLKMKSESDRPSLLEKLQIAEYAAIQELTMRTAKRGHAVMCSGANLIVRREAWLACEPDLHPEIPSGDDMFLLEAMKKRGYKISVIDEPDYTAVVRPQTTWRAFFRQRMRWAGKAPKYTDPDILRCGALIVAANLLQLLCPLILLIKFPIEYGLIRRRQMREHKIINYQLSIINFSIALLLEILYPYYILLSLLGGLFRQKKW